MKKTKVRVFTFSIIMLLLLAVIISGCNGNEGPAQTPEPAPAPAPAPAVSDDETAGDEIEGTYVMRIGAPTAGKHSQNYTIEKFAEEIEIASGGKITVEFYPAGQLGTTAQMAESVLDGSLQGIGLPHSYFVTFAPAVAVLDLPFLFDSDAEGGAAEQIFRILNEGTSLDQCLEDQGFVLAMWTRGGFNYYRTREPFETLADLSGKKIRCHTSEIQQAQVTAFGAYPAMVDTGDIAAALQNGTVDGLQTDVIFATTQKLYEHAPNYTLVGSPAVNIVLLSKVWMDTLPENVRTLILDTATDVCMGASRDYYIEYSEECFDEIEAAGVRIIEPSPELIGEMTEVSQTIYDKFINLDADCARVYDEFLGLIKADSAAN